MGGKRKLTPVIEQWWIQFISGDESQPWSERRRRVCGQVYGHSVREDGTPIETSYVVRMCGLLVTTASGSGYRLGTPSGRQRAYMEVAYPGWDWRNPMKEPGV